MKPGDLIRFYPNEQDRKFITDSTSLLFHEGQEFSGTITEVDDAGLVNVEAQFVVMGVTKTLEFRGLVARSAEAPELLHAYDNTPVE